MEEVIQAKVESLTARALNIYCATKNVFKKDVLTEALAGRSHIPPEFYALAKKEIELEDCSRG